MCRLKFIMDTCILVEELFEFYMTFSLSVSESSFLTLYISLHISSSEVDVDNSLKLKIIIVVGVSLFFSEVYKKRLQESVSKSTRL